MSKPRDLAPVQDRLARLLDTSQLARVIPHLGPGILHQVIEYRGLAACTEILPLLAPDQLASVLDLDLWRAAEAAGDEQFDPDRFGEWIETLVDLDEATAARMVAGIDERLVVAGLSRFVRVIDPAACAGPWSFDETMEEAEEPFSGVTVEVGGYLLRARRTDGWDAVVTLLVALEAGHRDCFHAVMGGCRRLSSSVPEIDGLDELMAEPAQLSHDVAVDREARRAEQGYLTPADARAFLQMARQPAARGRRTSPGAASSLPINPIAAAYLSAPDPNSDSTGSGAPLASEADAEPLARDAAADEASVLAELLAEAGVVPGRSSSLLLEAPPGVSSRPARMRALMEHARAADETAYLARNRELAFLANCLMAGCSIQARAFTVGEASDAVVATCELGLEHWPARWQQAGGLDAAPAEACPVTLPVTFLLAHDLVTAFQVGWAALHEMSMAAAGRLIALLAGSRFVEGETQQGLECLRRELVRQHRAGTPWRARDALDVVASLDVPAWTALLGVLDECPVLPAALRAVIERQTGAVSATAFEFISATGQIVCVRAFMERLPEVLAG
jgi:hypothetical protein